MVHEGDGGRYLGTWGLVATRDLDTPWVNWGLYRLMIHDRHHMGTQMNPFQHIGMMFFGKYEPKGLEMDFAAAFGGDPLLTLAAGMDYGLGKDEADLAGGLRGAPVELVPCETVDLAVPAQAEIVVEGKFLPGVRLDEGPFGEYTGYRTAPRAPRPVCRVTAITYRQNPILPISCLGIPVDDGHVLLSLSFTISLKRTLREQGFPVRDIYIPPECVGHMVIVSVEARYSNIASQLASAIWGSKIGVFTCYVLVVDADVDIFNMPQVLHALVTKCHPGRGIRVMPQMPGHPLMPFANEEERLWGKGASVLFDCTWPLEWPRETEVPFKISFDSAYSQAVRERVVANWSNYGYK